MTRKRTRTSQSGRQGKRKVLRNEEYMHRRDAMRDRFEKKYAELCEQAGQPVVYYYCEGDYIFHLFGLYRSVLHFGGYSAVCARSLWGHIAATLCRVSKRKIGAARQAQACYRKHLLQYEEKLDVMKLNASLDISPCDAERSSSQETSGQRSTSGGSPKSPPGPDFVPQIPSVNASHSPSPSCVKTKPSPLMPSGPLHLVRVKIAGHNATNPTTILPLVVGPCALIDPQGVRPDRIPPPPMQPQTYPVVEIPSNGTNDELAVETGNGVALSRASDSPVSRNKDFGFMRLVPVPVPEEVKVNSGEGGDVSANNNRAVPLSQVKKALRNAGQVGFGNAVTTRSSRSGLSRKGSGSSSGVLQDVGEGEVHDMMVNASVHGGVKYIDAVGSRKRVHRQSSASIGEARHPNGAPREVPDVVPGDRVKSMVSWVRELAQNQAHPFSDQTRHNILHLRYGGELLRALDKHSHFQKELYKQEEVVKVAARKDNENPALPFSRSRRQRDVETWYDQESESEEEPEVREGVEYQAEIPAWRPLPSAPTEEEAKWITEPVWPGAINPGEENMTSNSSLLQENQLSCTFNRPVDFHDNMDVRHAWVDKSTSALEESLGPAAKDLGLYSMGYRVRQTWTPQEEAHFESGLRTHGRDFMKVQEFFVPSKTIVDVVLYYYNIWKLQRTPLARAWYLEREQQELASLKQEEDYLRQLEQEKLRAEERAREARLKMNQKRAVKDIVAWIRGTGQNPHHINLVQRGLTLERGLRTKALLRVTGANDQEFVGED